MKLSRPKNYSKNWAKNKNRRMYTASLLCDFIHKKPMERYKP